MSQRLLNIIFLIFSVGTTLGFTIQSKTSLAMLTNKSSITSQASSDYVPDTTWGPAFKPVDIISSADQRAQKAYFYRSTANVPQPLVVSLHTWSGDYEQYDALAALCQQQNVNYIHPNFRGSNTTEDACCSALAMADIDDAITYALAHANVDTSRVFVIGVSGGGYATLSTFMKSKHRIRKFSAWAAIADLAAWYHESTVRENKYAANILACTGSVGDLNVKRAQQRSPLHWPTPTDKLSRTSISIYAGVYDGIQGSVPITHSINFYNKVLADRGVSDTSAYVTAHEKLKLLEFRRPLGSFGSIGGRKICLVKEFDAIRLTVFEGNHEMLPEFALQELLATE